MEVHLLGRLPDEIATWAGSAESLAAKCNELMPACGLEAEVGSANERLVRHYVQIGVMTPPKHEGRDAVFGARQIAEFLAARRLLSEGWPLAKIGELLKHVVLVEDTALAEGAAASDAAKIRRPERTEAEKALQRIQASGPQAGRGKQRRVRSSPEPHVESRLPFRADSAAELREDSSSLYQVQQSLLPLQVATQIARSRGELRNSLMALGNESGAPERQRMLRISLTTWCHVDIESGHLARLAETDPDILGNALAHALREERLRKVSKS